MYGLFGLVVLGIGELDGGSKRWFICRRSHVAVLWV